jgi:hypothetical protein
MECNIVHFHYVCEAEREGGRVEERGEQRDGGRGGGEKQDLSRIHKFKERGTYKSGCFVHDLTGKSSRQKYLHSFNMASLASKRQCCMIILYIISRTVS